MRGSGTEGNPIIVDMYGTGAKPLIQPGPDWVEANINQATEWMFNVSVNNTLELVNVSYWEVNNLELHDPKFDTVNPRTTNV